MSSLSAKELLRAMMAQYLDSQPSLVRAPLAGDSAMSAGRYDLLWYAAQVARDLSADDAAEWLAEELQDMLAARG